MAAPLGACREMLLRIDSQTHCAMHTLSFLHETGKRNKKEECCADRACHGRLLGTCSPCTRMCDTLSVFTVMKTKLCPSGAAHLQMTKLQSPIMLSSGSWRTDCLVAV